MTPVEIVVLFYSYVFVFCLIWITCIAEHTEEAQSSAQRCKSAEHMAEPVDLEPPSWNVAAFLGLKALENKKRVL
jgi:hypothetical protein